MRIALFVTCLVDALFPRVGQATVTLLERLGHDVDFPAGQTCCGQMHVNTGYQRSSASTTSAPTTRTGSPTIRPAIRCACCASATGRCGCCATSAA